MGRNLVICIIWSSVFTALLVAQQESPAAKKKAPTATEIRKEAERQVVMMKTVHFAAVKEYATQTVCAGQPLPAGWVVTGDRWNPTTCGNPSSIVYNVWFITQVSNLPVNSTIDMCAYSPGGPPQNWVVVGGRWNPTACSNPPNIVNNITTIRRIQ